jgi:hypothetical protein
VAGTFKTKVYEYYWSNFSSSWFGCGDGMMEKRGILNHFLK